MEVYRNHLELLESLGYGRPVPRLWRTLEGPALSDAIQQGISGLDLHGRRAQELEKASRSSEFFTFFDPKPRFVEVLLSELQADRDLNFLRPELVAWCEGAAVQKAIPEEELPFMAKESLASSPGPGEAIGPVLVRRRRAFDRRRPAGTAEGEVEGSAGEQRDGGATDLLRLGYDTFQADETTWEDEHKAAHGGKRSSLTPT